MGWTLCPVGPFGEVACPRGFLEPCWAPGSALAACLAVGVVNPSILCDLDQVFDLLYLIQTGP